VTGIPGEQLTPTSAARVTLPGPTGPLAALVADPGARQGTILLVPGYTGSKEDFAPILDPLAGSGYRVVAIDLPGQFESPGPDDEDSYAPLALGEVCAALVADLSVEQPLVLLGHSFGGLVARGAVLAGAPVAGLVLLCSGPKALPAGQRRESLVAGEPVLRESNLQTVYEGTVAVGRAARKQVPADVAALLRRRFLASNPAGLLGMGTALQQEPDRVVELRAALAAVAAPVAVIAGVDDDAWSPAEQADMAQRLGTELIVIDQAAHSPAVENPAALVQVLLGLLVSWLPAG
jgi:pimeloyl-ACP methyl ester carboxylesterase